MQKKILIMVIGVLLLCSLFWIIPILRSYSYLSQQRQLANILGVSLDDYRQFDFPFQYFDEALKPGMSIKDVHQIMRGYELVFKCRDWGEIYFYFDRRDKYAFKYLILYDDNKKFESLIVDDINNSMSVSANGCEEGYLR